MTRIDISLDRNPAIVLFEWLASVSELELPMFQHEAEQQVLWDIECQPEQVLNEPFSPKYETILESARRAVSEQ